MHLGVKQLRNRVTEFVSLLNEKEIPESLKEAIGVWLERKDEKEPAREVADAFLSALNEADLTVGGGLREKIRASGLSDAPFDVDHRR